MTSTPSNDGSNTTDNKKTGTLGLWLLIAAAGVGVYMVARKQ